MSNQPENFKPIKGNFESELLGPGAHPMEILGEIRAEEDKYLIGDQNPEEPATVDLTEARRQEIAEASKDEAQIKFEYYMEQLRDIEGVIQNILKAKKLPDRSKLSKIKGTMRYYLSMVDSLEATFCFEESSEASPTEEGGTDAN